METQAGSPERGVSRGGRQAPDVGRRLVLVAERIAALWGNWAPNRLVDGAGRHRRLAVGCALLTIPFFIMGAATTSAYADRVASFGLFLVAGSFLWLAFDLTRSGRLVASNRLPHLSVVSLGTGFFVVRGHRPEQLVGLFESQPLLVTGLVLFAAAVVVLIMEDRSAGPAPSAQVFGRILLVSSAFILAYAAMAASFTSSMTPAYSLGVGAAGALLLGMALFEGRLLWRGLVLACSIRSK